MILYPWPITVINQSLSEALEIAMGYLEGTGQANSYSRPSKGRLTRSYPHGERA